MSAYIPEYIAGINTPDDLIKGIRCTLETWLMMHTDAESWAAEWMLDGDEGTLKELLEHGISNNWFSFDVGEAVYTEWAKDNARYFSQCEKCGTIIDDGWDRECGCEPEDDEELSDDRWIDCDVDDLIEWVKDVGISPEQALRYVEDALINQGFEIYRDALASVTGGVEEECQTAIDNIDNAETKEDQLYAAMQAAGIYHVNGEIMRDYGDRCGLDYDDLCKLRAEGLKAFFSSEEINEWMES